jgi:hypothetical protein
MSNSLKIRNIIALSVAGLLLVSPVMVVAQAPQNTVDPNTDRTQQAPAVRDRSANQNSQTLFIGTLAAKDASSLTIRSNSGMYRVMTNSGTQFLGANRRPISLSRIGVNDRVRVRGTLIRPQTIGATIVRDISR